MEQPNESMTWKEMVKRYPDKWVIVEKTKGDLSNIEEGIVRFVVTDEEMPEVWIKCLDEGFDYDKDRTTVVPFMGVVDGVNFDISVEEMFSAENGRCRE